ncbi:hypothetical protein KAT95_01195 [Candidatus Parcubacteria bacterium]|nr:hypothetical protein [Candidatus Parcubacteria bacterium]
MKTKLNIYYLSIDKQLDIIEEQIREKIRKTQELVWFDFKEYFSHEEQLKIIGIFVFVIMIGISTFFIVAFELAVLFFLLTLVIEYFLYNNIKNFIERDKRIEKIRNEMQEMRNDL